MPATIATNVLDADYTVRLVQGDVMQESTRKTFKVRNINSDIQNALRAYEGISQAAIEDGSANISTDITGANTVATGLGLFGKIGDFLALTFVRAHPIVAGRTVERTFVILAPHPDIYDTGTKKPVMVRGETFATALAGTRPMALGSLVDWLEDALIYEHDEVPYVGGFTYSEARSGLGGFLREYDGSDLT